ncbi:MAG: hypothetical protein H0X04_02020 [Chthoniobacterales bacterium]|nr:hypothetical protein [Chthoniobacterales bacterium]
MRFCDETGVDSYWNPEEHVLVGFVCFLTLPTKRSPEGLKQGTMKVYLYAVRHAHVIAGLKNPLQGASVLESALRAVKRKQGAAKKPRLPVTVSLLSAMKEFVFEESKDVSIWRLHDARCVWAILCMGVFGMFRLGELLGDSIVRDEDFVWLPSQKLVAFHLKSSKTDPFRLGCQVKLFFTGTPVDPYRALFDLVSLRPAGLGGATRNTATFSMSDGKVLSRAVFVSMLRALCAKVEKKLGLGLNAQHFSGHSLRRGGATSMYLRGCSSDTIRTMGRWRSLSYRLYIDSSNDVLLHAQSRMAMVTTESLAGDLGVQQQVSPNVPNLWTAASAEEDDDA